MIKNGLILAALLLFLTCCASFAGEERGDGSCYKKPEGYSHGELDNLEKRFKKPQSPAPNTVPPGLDFNKLNPLKTKLSPQKNLEVNFFKSAREFLVVSILGLFGLLGSTGLIGLYRAVRKKKDKKLRGLDL